MKHSGKNVRENDVKICVRVNAKNYLQIIDYCNKKHISVSQYVRQLIFQDLKHPSYDVEDEYKTIIGNMFKRG